MTGASSVIRGLAYSPVSGDWSDRKHVAFELLVISILSLIHSLQGNLPAPLLILDADQGIEKMLETYEKFTVTLVLLKNTSSKYNLVRMFVSFRRI